MTFTGPKYLIVFLFLASLSGLVQGQIHYKVDGRSSHVKYFMDHPVHQWDATSREAAGGVDMADDLAPNTVAIAIPVLSFNSDNGTRDAQMAEALEYQVYPNVSFVSTKIASEKFVSDNHHAASQWTIDGQLTFHGVTKNVRMPVSVVLDGKKLIATGAFELRLTDFNIELPSLLLLPVENWIKITFCIIAETQKMPELSQL